MKSLIIILTFIGILAVTVGYVNQIKKCPPPKVEYRYIPRTFEEEQENPPKVSELFNTMFSQPSPWIRGVLANTPKNSDINRYFISQS